MKKMESVAMFILRWWKLITGILTFLGFYINKYLNIIKELALIKDAVHSCETDPHYALITRAYCNIIVPKWNGATPMWDAGKEMCIDAWDIFANQIKIFFTLLYVYWPLFLLTFLLILHYTWKMCLNFSKMWKNSKKLMQRDSINSNQNGHFQFESNNSPAIVCTPIIQPTKRLNAKMNSHDEFNILQPMPRRIRVEDLDEDDP